MKTCLTPGCPGLAPKGKSRCPSCQDRFGYKKPEYHKMYNNARWDTLRARVLHDEPFCVECKHLATVVDHIVPHRGDQKLFYDRNNLQALCKTCHDRKTARGE